MAFTGYQIFPGLTTKGIIAPAIQELAVTFNMEAINALQMPVDEDMAWSEIAGVTPAIFQGKIPIDFTALDGFEPFKGTRTFKQIDVAALQVDVNQWDRNLEWPLIYDAAGAPVGVQQVYNIAAKAQAMVAHARVMKARLCATILMQGSPSLAKAKVYAGNDIPGANLSLFNTLHYANPMDANSRKFANYYPAAGLFDTVSMAATKRNMRAVPSPSLSAETLGLQVTDIIGGSGMETAFEQIQMQTLALQIGTGTATGAAAATTNIYAGNTKIRYWIAPQLDSDPYLVANPGKHLWFAVSRKLPGAHAVEMAAPTKEFTPRIQIFGDGTEMAANSRKVHLIGDLDAGAAAGLPHVIARYEQT
jgi:hypothetical protein